MYADIVPALKPPTSQIDGRSIADYIAYSVLLHLADGWTFLSRGLEAVKAGDGDTAIHMGYYAELRGAMSLLAAEGVGVFDRRHAAVDTSYGTSDLVGPGTHTIVWELLKEWGNDTNRSPSILEAIVVEQRPISDWLTQAGRIPTVQHVIANNWLTQWSLDLRQFSEDRDARNQASYRPHRIAPSSGGYAGTSSRIVDPLLNVWDSLEPTSDPGGAAIDRSLLGRALSLVFDRANQPVLAWHKFIDDRLAAASFDLRQFLKRPASNYDPILGWASQSSTPAYANAVIARATLLLRVACGLCALRLEQALVKKDHLRFWWDQMGQESGYWMRGDEPATFADLWNDIDYAVVEVKNTIKGSSSPIAVLDLHKTFAPYVALTQYSRALLWMLRFSP